MTETEKFNFAATWVLWHEAGYGAGYSNDPRDAGGETAFGFSSVHHPDLDPKTMTRQKAKREIHDRYWTRYRINEIKHPFIAAKVLDICVWMGPDDAGRYLQMAVNAAAGIELLKVDGVIGSKTIAATNAVDPGPVLMHLRHLVSSHTRRRARERPQDKDFALGGWWDRAYA